MRIKTREVIYSAFIGSILYLLFVLFSNILYVEMLTFTLIVFSLSFPIYTVVYGALLFGMLQILLNGLLPWNVMYLCIYPLYALITYVFKNILENHPLRIAFYGMFLSFLMGQLMELPFLFFSKTITIAYILLGLKTSIIQSLITFLEFLFLFDPVKRILIQIRKESL